MSPESSSPEQEKKHIEKGDEAPLEHGDEMKPGETAENAATRLTEEYVAKGSTEVEHGKQAVAKAVENGRKEGLKIS